MTRKIYKITSGNGLHELLNAYLITVASFAISVLHRSGKEPNLEPGKYAIMECFHLGGQMEIPLAGLIEIMIKNGIPGDIDVAYDDIYTPPAETSYNDKARTFLRMTTTSLFLMYYEKHKSTLKHFSNHTDAWKMAWAVRNTIAHDGRVFFERKSHRGASWRGLEISPNDDGNVLLGNLVSEGDLIALLLEMENDRPMLTA